MNDADIEIQHESGPLILVFDIPLAATTEETAGLLEGPCVQGYYLGGIVPWPGVGARVILRRYAAKSSPKQGADAVTKEARAMQFIRDNREMTNKELSAALKALGFPRGVVWVAKKRMEIIRTDRRVT